MNHFIFFLQEIGNKIGQENPWLAKFLIFRKKQLYIVVHKMHEFI